MNTFREYFGLTEYPEEFIEKIIDYRMCTDKDPRWHLSFEEIAAKEHCTAEDVHKILRNTAIVWNH